MITITFGSIFFFNFQAFKNLSKLILVEVDCGPDKITSLGCLRGTVKHLEVHKCGGVVSPSDILMSDGKNGDEDQLDDVLSQPTNNSTNSVKEVS